MQAQDQQKFKDLMTLIAETYGKELSQVKAKSWWVMFRPFSIEQFEQAVYSHLMDADEGRFHPTPAHLMKHISGTAKQQAQEVDDRAEIAWLQIEKEIRRVGSYGDLKLSDRQALAAVQAVGGWRTICASTHEQLVWKKKEFMSVYETLERADPELLPSYIRGRISESGVTGESKRLVTNVLTEIQNRFGNGKTAEIEK
jgi:hypothetical protein